MLRTKSDRRAWGRGSARSVNQAPVAPIRRAAWGYFQREGSAFGAFSSPTFAGTTNTSIRNSLDENAISIGYSRKRR